MLLQCQAVQISHLFPKWTDLWFLALLEPFVVKTRAISSNTLAEELVPWRQLAYLPSSVSSKWRHVSSLQWKGNTHFRTFLLYHMLCRFASSLWAAHKKQSWQWVCKNNWFPTRGDFVSLEDFWPCLKKSLVITTTRLRGSVLLESSEQRSEMLLNILECTGHLLPPTTRSSLHKLSIVP